MVRCCCRGHGAAYQAPDLAAFPLKFRLSPFKDGCLKYALSVSFPLPFDESCRKNTHPSEDGSWLAHLIAHHFAVVIFSSQGARRGETKAMADALVLAGDARDRDGREVWNCENKNPPLPLF